MSVIPEALMVVLAVLAVVWQVSYSRAYRLLGGKDDGQPRYCACLVVLFFAGFVVYHGYHETVVSPEFRKDWEGEGLSGYFFRSRAVHIVIWLVIKALLFGMMVMICLILAPLFLTYCAGAVAFVFLRGIDENGIPLLDGYVGWLFEGVPAWVGTWYLRLQIAVSLLFTQVYRDVDPRPFRMRLRESINFWTLPFVVFWRLLVYRISPPRLRLWEDSGQEPPRHSGAVCDNSPAPSAPTSAVPAVTTDEASLDAVLAKIAHSGQASLTSAEREFLAKCAERLRTRPRK